jgi:Holliday junction resolvase RusA-like endonuclease
MEEKDILVKFIIPGEPQPKQRPRVLKSGHAYTPKETVNYEKLVRKCYNNIYKDIKLNGALQMKVITYFAIPKSEKKINKEKMLLGEIRPIKRLGDWDNLGKIVSDALNEVAYDDDSQIVEATVTKWYSDNPRMEVIISELIESSDINEITN